jgi:hypothetical protein
MYQVETRIRIVPSCYQLGLRRYVAIPGYTISLEPITALKQILRAVRRYAKQPANVVGPTGSSVLNRGHGTALTCRPKHPGHRGV